MEYDARATSCNNANGTAQFVQAPSLAEAKAHVTAVIRVQATTRMQLGRCSLKTHSPGRNPDSSDSDSSDSDGSDSGGSDSDGSDSGGSDSGGSDSCSRFDPPRITVLREAAGGRRACAASDLRRPQAQRAATRTVGFAGPEGPPLLARQPGLDGDTLTQTDYVLADKGVLQMRSSFYKSWYIQAGAMSNF